MAIEAPVDVAAIDVVKRVHPEFAPLDIEPRAVGVAEPIAETDLQFRGGDDVVVRRVVDERFEFEPEISDPLQRRQIDRPELAGADVGFVEGPTDADELQRVGKAVDGPVLYNFVGELGTSPYVSMESLDDWGFDLVIFPILATLSTIASVHADMQAFADDPAAAMADVDDAFNAQPVGSLHEFSGFPEVIEWEERYLPETDQEKYDGSLGDELSE